MIKWVKSLDRILRGEATGVGALESGAVDVPVVGLSIVLILLGMLYGLCMGCFALIRTWGDPLRHHDGLMQVLASAVKVPALFFLTLLVTFPSLYVFNALVGSRLTIASVLRLLIAALSVMLAVLASFGTIVAFFSFTTTSYPFMLLLNVVVFGISGVLGLAFLLQTLHRLSVADEMRARAAAVQANVSLITSVPAEVEGGEAPPPIPAFTPMPGALAPLAGRVIRPSVRTVFRIWIVVFGLVGAQMGWVLRPFVGNPEQPFSWFRPRESHFFESVVHAITRLAGWR